MLFYFAYFIQKIQYVTNIGKVLKLAPKALKGPSVEHKGFINIILKGVSK
jgi:hypothetical protein